MELKEQQQKTCDTQIFINFLGFLLFLRNNGTYYLCLCETLDLEARLCISSLNLLRDTELLSGDLSAARKKVSREAKGERSTAWTANQIREGSLTLCVCVCECERGREGTGTSLCERV